MVSPQEIHSINFTRFIQKFWTPSTSNLFLALNFNFDFVYLWTTMGVRMFKLVTQYDEYHWTHAHSVSFDGTKFCISCLCCFISCLIWSVKQDAFFLGTQSTAKKWYQTLLRKSQKMHDFSTEMRYEIIIIFHQILSIAQTTQCFSILRQKLIVFSTQKWHFFHFFQILYLSIHTI